MSSEHLASAETELKGELGAAWNILSGANANYTDLGIARRFGGASAAYSLRDIGAMNGRVVKVRRDVDGQGSDPEEDFSANQVQSGALEDWVNGKLESTLPADVATAAAAYSLRKVKASYSGNAVRIRRDSDNTEVNVAFDSDDKVSSSSSISLVSGSTSATDLNGFLNEKLTVGTAVNGTGSFDNYTVTNATTTGFSADNSSGGVGSAGFPYSFATNDVIVVRYTVSNFSSTSSLSPQIRGVTNTNNVTSVASVGTTFTANGTYTDTLTASADGNHLMFADANTGSYTISDFEIVSHNHQAFVQTWYDQAGSNNATQNTYGSQPKIAENGALLADGLKFNGNSDNFTITNGVSGRSIFAVTNQNIDTTAGGLNGYGQDGISSLLGTAGTNSYIFVSNNNSAFNSYAISIDGAASDSGQYASNGKTLSSAGGNLGTYGDIPSDTNSLISIIYGSGDPANAWTRLGSGISGNIFMQGSMSEVILYTSDQSDNRFKIESNINNYYGLYNDANEFASDETAFRFLNERSGGTSTSSDLTQFTLDVQTASAYAGAKFASDVVIGDSIFVSFNASLDEGSFTASPKVGLRNIDSSLNGTLYSNEGTVTEGFNSFQLTSTNSAASGIVWSEGDDNAIFTISNIKVSRIARNGFVETWYDQSGNGNDAVQATATEQPSIVQNGGIVKLNGKPSVNFDGVDNYFTFTNSLNFNLEPTSLTRPVNTIMFVGENTAGSRSFLGDEGATKNWIAAPYSGTYQFRDNGSTIYDTTVSATLGSQLVLSIQCPSEDNFSIRENGSAKTVGGTNNITAAIGIRDMGAGYTLSGTTQYQTMKAQEFYFHNERLPNDIVDIENDAINYYNIS